MGQAGAAFPGAQGCQGPRSGGGWEGGLGLGCSGEKSAVEGGSRGREQKGEDLVYCFGPGNMSLFAGERSQERPRNKRRGTMVEAGPTGGLGTRRPTPQAGRCREEEKHAV